MYGTSCTCKHIPTLFKSCEVSSLFILMMSPLDIHSTSYLVHDSLFTIATHTKNTFYNIIIIIQSVNTQMIHNYLILSCTMLGLGMNNYYSRQWQLEPRPSHVAPMGKHCCTIEIVIALQIDHEWSTHMHAMCTYSSTSVPSSWQLTPKNSCLSYYHP